MTPETLIDTLTFRCPYGHEWAVPAYTTGRHLVLRVCANDAECPVEGSRGRWIADGPDPDWPDAAKERWMNCERVVR